MKVYCCQTDIAWEDKKANQSKIHSLIATAKVEPGSLIVLPEMFATGFSMNVAAIHEPIGGVTEQFLCGLAGEFQCFVVGGIVTLAEDGRGRNEALAITPDGQLAHRYCKLHPFTFGGESQHYQPGKQIVKVRCGQFLMAPFVCYDLRFPEIFRSAVQQGVELFVVIANWPAKREEHWVTLLRARAIENQAYVVGVNRVGQDPKLAYPGRSMVIDPKGGVLLDLADQERVGYAEIEHATLVEWRREFPALQDMRVDVE